VIVLCESERRAREAAHRARVRPWTETHRQRQAAGAKHPMLDFLFTYYSFRPARLERWASRLWRSAGRRDGIPRPPRLHRRYATFLGWRVRIRDVNLNAPMNWLLNPVC